MGWFQRPLFLFHISVLLILEEKNVAGSQSKTVNVSFQSLNDVKTKQKVATLVIHRRYQQTHEDSSDENTNINPGLTVTVTLEPG